MKILRLPSLVKGFLFDMDQTLYRHQEYYDSQLKNQVILVAQRLKKTPTQVQEELDAFERRFQNDHGGRKPSFGNLLRLCYGIPIEESVELRRAAIRPEDYLEPDQRLRSTLEALSGRLVVVTNNPADIARRTLEALGVRDLFPRIIGLDESGHSKPHPRPFELALEALDLPAGQCLAIGDRIPVDLELPLEMGMGAVLVESMEDVYGLPGVLARGEGAKTS